MGEDVEMGAVAFEEKHLIAIMLFLAVNGSSRKIDIYKYVSTNPRIPEKLDRLEALGLITQVPDRSVRSVIISLTPKGKSIAQSLVDIDNAVKN